MRTTPPNTPPTPRRLQHLTTASRALTFATSQQDVVDLTVKHAATLVEADRVVLMLTDDDGLLHIRAARGFGKRLLDRFRRSPTAQPTEQLRGMLGQRPERCFLGVPLVSRGRVIGVLAGLRPEDRPYTGEEECLLSLLADQAGVALENTKLEQELRTTLEGRVQAMKDATMVKDRALATLGHDLRSPLHAIESYGRILDMELLGPINPKQEEALARIRVSGRHILALVENTAEMARLDAGIVEIECEDFPVDRVIREAASIVETEARTKGQTLRIEAEPDLVVHADVDRLRQALVNLLDNAVKYAPPGGRVTIAAARTGRDDGDDRVALRITDTGPGIPFEDRESIFQPYYQTDAASAGSGLGLAIARTLVRQMDGDIEVSDAPGTGTTFTIRLKLSGG